MPKLSDAWETATNNEPDLKALWRLAENQDCESLLFSETIDVKIGELSSGEAPSCGVRGRSSERSPNSKAPTKCDIPEMSIIGAECSSLLPSATSASAPPPRPPPDAMSTEQQAQIVHLLMKNQSAHIENRLTPHETHRLRILRTSHSSEQWRLWEIYASRMRVLLREQKRRRLQSVAS